MDNAKEVLIVEIERSKLNREKSLVVLDKSLLLYFSFMFVAVIGLINNYIDISLFNTVVMMGFAVLIIGLIPYVLTMRKEERKLEKLIMELKGAKRGGKHE